MDITRTKHVVDSYHRWRGSQVVITFMSIDCFVFRFLFVELEIKTDQFLCHQIISVAHSAAPASSASAAPAKVAAAPADDDVDDMFGADDEDVDEDGETAAEAAATVARQARMALAKKLKDEKDAKDGKSGAKKDKPVEKSLVVLEVKPWEADTNLEEVTIAFFMYNFRHHLIFCQSTF